MTIKSYTVGPGSLIFGETGSPQEMAAQITSATVTPSVDVDDDIPVLSGEVLPGERTYTYVLEGNFLQDLATTGITPYTYTNKGLTVPFIYTPNDVEARSISGSVIIDPTSVGGDVKKKATSDFSFGVVGEPAFGDVEP